MNKQGTRRILRKQPTATISLTESELRLLFADFNTSIGCGAEDPDYVSVRDKVGHAIEKVEAADKLAARGRK